MATLYQTEEYNCKVEAYVAMKKKIGILTYFWSDNPGTFLQAWCVKRMVSEIFPEAHVELVRYELDTAPPDFVNHGKGLSFLGKLSVIPSSWRRKHIYDNLRSTELNITREKFYPYQVKDSVDFFSSRGYDLLVVGSDTVLQVPPFCVQQNQLPFFWIPPSVSTRKILLSASGGATDFDALNSELRVQATESANDFDLLTVRDEMVHEFLKSLPLFSHDKLMIMPDPTYLLAIDPDAGARIAGKYAFAKRHKILCINLPTDFPRLGEIVALFRKKGFYIVSLKWNPFADVCLVAISPFEWASVMHHFTMVITERFHDTVFALRSQIPILSIDIHSTRFRRDRKSKLYCLLKLYNLEKTHHLNILDINTAENVVDLAEIAMRSFPKYRVEQMNLLCIQKLEMLRELIAEVATGSCNG